MQMLHTLNLIIHVSCGTIALLIGFIALLKRSHFKVHKRFGRYFLRLLAVVVTTGFIGFLLFRSNSFLLMLTFLSGYVGYAGYRTIQLHAARSSTTDAIIAAVALTSGCLYLVSMQLSGGDWSPSVIYPTLGALALVTLFDLVKHFWLHPQLKNWWLYEHIYKMVSAYSAIASAFVGTILPGFKPYSQIGPSTLALIFIIYAIWQQVGKQKANRIRASTFQN
jgi:hypothetical protein